jgi:hypothetical protein
MAVRLIDEPYPDAPEQQQLLLELANGVAPAEDAEDAFASVSSQQQLENRHSLSMTTYGMSIGSGCHTRQ